MKPFSEAFPECKPETDCGYIQNRPSYTDLLESTGWVPVVEVQEQDYQGSIYVLVTNDAGQYGYLAISFGSCSGCDALKACNKVEELDELRGELAQQVTVFPTLSAAAEAIENDRELDVTESWHSKEKSEFKAKVRALVTP